MWADDAFVRLAQPSLEGEAQVGACLPRMPVANDFEEVFSGEDGEKQVEDEFGGPGDGGTTMRQGKVLQGEADRGRRIVGVAHRDRNDSREPADVFPLNRAANGLFTAGVIEEKPAVGFLDVGFAMAATGGEEVEVTAGVVVEVVTALFEEGFLKQGG